MSANGKLLGSELASILGVKLSTKTANALNRAIAASKWKITIALPGGGYRSFALQTAMKKAADGTNIAEKKKYNLSLSSTVVLSYPGYSSHGFGTRVDLLFNGSDNPTTEQINFMKKYGFTREFGGKDRNHFMHDGKTAITKIEETKSMTIEGVDYSYARPTVKQLQDAGKKFVVRYITTPGAQNKGISQAEYDALHKAGIAVAVVYELDAKDMLKGKNQGIADAKAAQANLKAIVGLGDTLPVYFACDWDATPEQQDKINDYLDGAASVIGRNRVGIYGGYYPLKRAKAAGKATWFWQTFAWSGGKVLEGIHLYQWKVDTPLGSGSVDYVRAMKDEYGQHGVAAPAPAKPAVPVVVESPKPAEVPVAGQIDKAVDANASFDPNLFRGTYYIKGSEEDAIYAYDALRGTKRHLTAAEWQIVKGYGHATFLTLTQNDVDKIKTV